MINNLLFDFAVDRDTATIRITREFASDLDLVWDAFTKPEILDQWFAPKPWRLQTKEMDFREGGRWLYAMISPENVSHWSLVNFTKIVDKVSFSSKNTFSDENGNVSTSWGLTYSLTDTIFKSSGDTTTVQIVKKMADLSQLEKFVEMGFKEGMAVVMKALDELLASLAEARRS